ncbi:uncharacterized protein B0I36DRAFT_27423 [Microdochium trichocladiopsis]|uniref:Uncharacterized protein n=1 Tax=Microdochium trichocladiopsis TaxID=1682393 RepID=A0A9P8XYQ4_9PEZI|nr:uncharacterized protein B0I36DRAFT_27423 [Microdochium trichocladiopsis]KAH7020964.1 hypothetical protein B0I36DRAFT_27423 [Microdochium trichocladiopsis]
MSSSTTRDARHGARSRSPMSPVPASPSKRSREDDYHRDAKRRATSRQGSVDHREGESRTHRHDRGSRHDRESRPRSRHRGGERTDHDRSDRHHHHHHRHSKPSKKPATAASAPELPYGARPLLYKTDLEQFRPILARYLDVQKQRDMYSMDEREIRGRWKSFVGKWNSAELASGWYDPDVFATAVLEDRAVMAEIAAAGGGVGGAGLGGGGHDSNGGKSRRDEPRHEHGESSRRGQGSREESGAPLNHRGSSSGHTEGSPGQPHDRQSHSALNDSNADDDDDNDEDYGPTLPGTGTNSTGRSQRTQHQAAAPSMPNLQDLALRRELVAEADEQSRADAVAQLRADRRADRVLQKERLEDLVPRADPGSRERRLEKRREVNDKMRSFRDASPTAEVDDRDLMGGGDGGGGGADDIAELKRQKAAEQRRKTEREIRREEEARAREAEREERLQSYKDKEDKTMAVLRELARQRFG